MLGLMFSAIFIVSLLGLCLRYHQRNMMLLLFLRQDIIALNKGIEGRVEQEQAIKKENEQKEAAAIKTMNLYEVTKEIGEFLKEDKIFERFKKGLKKFVMFEDCNFVHSITDQQDISGYEIIPLISRNKEYGYITIKGADGRERPVLDILIAQFLVGIKRARLYELVQTLAITDALTKAFTRRHFFVRYEEELRRSADLHLALSVLMIDIDDFKKFNDTYGHLVGDAILRKVADVIRGSCREIDLIGRFGGEEFTVALPMTNKDGALFAAERIRKSIETCVIKAFDEKVSVTVSIGVASYPYDASTNQELIDKADWALYRSKRTGKNKVSVYAQYE